MDLQRGSGNANVPPNLTPGQISQNLARFSISVPRYIGKLREPTDFRVCPKATAIGKWTNKPRWVTSWQ